MNSQFKQTLQLLDLYLNTTQSYFKQNIAKLPNV